MFFPRMKRPICMLAALAAVSASHARAQQTVSAYALTDTVGINIHLGFDGTLYTANFPLVLSSLEQLHITHVRDGLSDWGTGTSTYYTRHQQLAAAGIHADFITSIGQTQSLFLRYPAQVKDMEAIEAPNELDTQYSGDWVAALQGFLPGLRALSGTEAYRGITVVGPSLVDVNWWTPENAYAQLGNVGSYFDLGNLHNYPSGRNPGNNGWSSNTYASISWAVSTAQAAWPGVGLVSTETGYRTDLPGSQSVPAAVAAKYIPRMVLEQYLHGVRRTYFYELADDQYSGGSFGLLTANGTPKPGFLTLKALMAELGASVALTPKSPAGHGGCNGQQSPLPAGRARSRLLRPAAVAGRALLRHEHG